MSELEKTKQIAAEAFNFKSKAYTTIEQQNEIIEVNRKALLKILSLSSPTIPKRIADELDSDNLLDFVDRVKTISDLPKSSARYDYSQTHRYWYYDMVAYLNPLTRDLVKVVEG